MTDIGKKEAKPNDMEPSVRSNRNMPVLNLMMEEFQVKFPANLDPKIKEQRLLAVEVIITVLLKAEGMAQHGDLMLKVQRFNKKNIVCKACGVSKTSQLYSSVTPILTLNTCNNIVKLHEKVISALIVDVHGFWRFKQANKKFKFVEGLEKEVVESESIVRTFEDTEDGNRAGSTGDSPPSKVARIEPLSRSETESKLSESDYHSKKRRLSGISDRKEASKEDHRQIAAKPEMKHKSTMTRQTEFKPSKIDRSTNTSVYRDGSWHVDDEPKRPEKLRHTRVFHCTICERVPKHHVVMDARCGRLVGCLPCVKEGKRDPKNCPHCGYKGRYIVLKYLHEKLMKMS